MPSEQTYLAPNLSQDQITPSLVRDELLKCFESANREFMGVLNQSVSDDQIKQQVQQFVTEVFHNCGLDFENPRKEGIVTAIKQCKKSAESMMGTGGNEIIQHHYKEMMKLVEKLQ